MRRAWIACVGVCLAWSAPAAADATRPKALRDRNLTIPLSVKATGVKECLLYVRRNGGEWAYDSKAVPGRDRSFDFRADADGLFDFCVQTVYKDGTVDPAKDQFTPMKSVVIDTLPPRITVRPVSQANGTCGVEWDVVDENVAPESVRLEYLWPGRMTDWRPIDERERHPARGQRFWDVRENGGKIMIRVRAKDTAGNEGISEGVTTSADAAATRVSNPRPGGDIDPASAAEPRREGPELQYLDSADVTINFKATVGPSSVGSVTLWVQQDAGPWKPEKPLAGAELQALMQQKSGPEVAAHDKTTAVNLPLRYQAPADGAYSFIAIAQSSGGASQPPPRPGSAPHVKVVIDTKNPEVKVIKTTVGGTEKAPYLDIAWSATDANMAAAPITLTYGTDLKQPNDFKPIVEGTDNTGRYRWEIPSGVPYKFYVKVKAVDRARRTAEASSGEVVVDLTPPRVDFEKVSVGGGR